MRVTATISSRAHISTTRGLLMLEIGKQKAVRSMPCAQLNSLIIESMQSTITTACLAKLAESKVVTTVCGRDHMPIGIYMPMSGGFNRIGTIRSQLDMKAELVDELWARIIRAKIANQAECLRLCGYDPAALLSHIDKVRPGDPDNREAIAARDYFDIILQGTGRRDGPYASSLDYGYSVPRSAIAREVVSSGWIPELGIHHKSRENSFNLIDDLIEPFRPLVDLLVMTYDMSGDLTKDDKALLGGSMGYFMRFDKKRYTATRCVELMMESFKRAVRSGDPDKLILPELIELALPEME